MINSRSIEDLHPKVAYLCHRFIEACAKLGIDVIITSTYRDDESQNALFAIGRTVKGSGVSEKLPMGRTVTKAKAGDSFHNYKVAFDFVPLRYGKPVWGTAGNGIDDNPADDSTDDLELWQKCGAAAKSVGLEWAGDWQGFKESAHCQYTGGLTLQDFKNGRRLA